MDRVLERKSESIGVVERVIIFLKLIARQSKRLRGVELIAGDGGIERSSP